MPPHKALVMGLNYTGHPSAALAGCVNDARHVHSFLTQTLQWHPDQVLLMTDDTRVRPSRAAMLEALKGLVLWTHRVQGGQVWISYSGHGTTAPDRNGDEADGQDEVLVPLDFDEAGYVSDDELAGLLQRMHPQAEVFLLIDCCHSGSMGDLPFRYVAGDKFAREAAVAVPARVTLLSGCRDHETAQEVWAYDDEKQVSGLMTSAFLAALEHHGYDVTCYKLLKYMWAELQARGAAQRPQLSSSRQLSETCCFITYHSQRPLFEL